jgi:preprotein translocase subunit SecD
MPNVVKKIAGLVAVSAVLFSATAANAPSKPILQMRLVVGEPSADSEPMALVHKSSDRDHTETIYVQKAVLLDQTALKSATVATDPLNRRPCIQIVFTKPGKKRFAEITRKNVDRRLAILINGKIVSAPVIRMEILSDTAQITGSLSEEEARELAGKITEALRRP